MPNVTVSVGTKMTAEDAQAIAKLADAEGIKPAEFIRRELRESIQRKKGGFPYDSRLILGELLAFKKTLIEFGTAHLRGVDITAEKALEIEADFDADKDRLADLSISRARENG
jgi:hypothetical protein